MIAAIYARKSTEQNLPDEGGAHGPTRWRDLPAGPDLVGTRHGGRGLAPAASRGAGQL